MKRKLELVTAEADAKNSSYEEKKTRTTPTTSTVTNAYRFKFADLQMSCKPVQKSFPRKDDHEDPPEAAHAVLCN